MNFIETLEDRTLFAYNPATDIAPNPPSNLTVAIDQKRNKIVITFKDNSRTEDTFHIGRWKKSMQGNSPFVIYQWLYYTTQNTKTLQGETVKWTGKYSDFKGYRLGVSAYRNKPEDIFRRSKEISVLIK